MFSKKEARAWIKAEIAKISVEEKQNKEKLIFENLKILLKSANGVWAGYQALLSEPQVSCSLIDGPVWAYPVMQGEQLVFKKRSSQFCASKWGVIEPLDGEIVPLSEVQGAVIPGLGFHQRGYRLGRGKGFYDRSLASYQKTKIGVCYDLAFSEKIAYEDHDLRMDYVVTESQVYKIK